MSARIRFCLTTALPLLTLGCAAVLTPAATTYSVPGDVDFTQLGSMKKGESCSLTVLGIFGPNGDASVATAASKAGITHVRYVDNRIRNYFLWYHYCVIAYGE
jgi:TRL-like protein family